MNPLWVLPFEGTFDPISIRFVSLAQSLLKGEQAAKGVRPLAKLSTLLATGFQKQMHVFDVISNNLSNVQTPGFKRDVPVFREVLVASRNGTSRQTQEQVKTVFEQGDLQRTGNPLHLAIEGEGFFRVKTPSGIRYTRAGNFRINREKMLIHESGFPVLGRQGEVTLRGREIVVEKNGSIKVDGSEIDQIVPVSFRDLGGLKHEGQGLFRLEGAQPEIPAEESSLLQGSLELSNVNPVQEMVKLIECLRTYESCAKMIHSNDEMDAKASNEIGRI